MWLLLVLGRINVIVMSLDRRVRSDLLETFKIINGYYDLTYDTWREEADLI